jgi:16S rRNA (cytidine1402-2'-O)-methyltransferase
MTADGSRELEPGLYLVGTPIGNLEDMTLRAIRVLKQADLIACEDTRQTQKLLNHYGIETRAVSYHEHSEASRAAELVEKLAQGGRIAVVSDAGMPGVSDPGFRLVSLAIGRDIPVFPVPGPAAFLAALVASGLPTDSFSFRGFLPAKSGARRRELEKILGSDETQIYYEAPHRIKEAVTDVVEVLGPDRPVVVARELTKIHEEFLRGTAAEVAQVLNSRGEIKGEISLLIGKAAEGQSAPRGVSVRERVEEIMREEKVDEKAALKKLAKERGISKSEAYRELQQRKY